MKTITLSGTEYKLPFVSNATVQQGFLNWAGEKLQTSPLDILREKIAGYPPEVQAMLVKEALHAERTPLSFASPEVQGLLGTPEGAAEIIRLFWQYYQPDLTPEKCWELHTAATEAHGAGYLA